MFSLLHLQLVHARQRELLDAALRHREAARDDHPRAARPHRAEVLWRVAEAVRARRPAAGPPAGQLSATPARHEQRQAFTAGNSTTATRVASPRLNIALGLSHRCPHKPDPVPNGSNGISTSRDSDQHAAPEL
jgi:hypothetical protein